MKTKKTVGTSSATGAPAKGLGWQPKIDVQAGIKKLFDWVMENREMF